MIVWILIFMEIILYLASKLSNKYFQWLIIFKDQHPKFNKNEVNSFFINSFDKKLGWIRKPNTSGVEFSKFDKTSFSINENGSRDNPNNIHSVNDIFTYGDSFTFCRQVNNEFTWQSNLSLLANKNVLNFGVGNFGIDQANLRYKSETKNLCDKIIIMGVVPETILRIHSYWKHYLEYGNVLAFKPRYILDNNALKLIENIISTKEDLINYKKHLSHIKKYDYFYKKKFKKDIIKFPYSLYYLKTFKRNLPLLISVLIMIFCKKLNIFKSLFYKIHKKFVLEKNTHLASELFNKKNPTKLLQLIIEDFNKYSLTNKSKPLLLIIPQLCDLESIKKNKSCYYAIFFKKLKKNINILDMTETFLLQNNFYDLYVDDKHGGHINEEGNKIISTKVHEKLQKLKYL